MWSRFKYFYEYAVFYMNVLNLIMVYLITELFPSQKS